MNPVTETEQLLQTFAGLLEKEVYEDLQVRLSARANPELRIEAGNEKTLIPIQVDLYPSRKILEGNRYDYGKRPLVLSPHIPGELAKDFRKNKINHADLNGRLFLKTPLFLLDREPREHVHKGPQTEADWFSQKSSRIIRSLLSHPGKEWNQKELVGKTRASGGLVSRILNSLVEERFLERKIKPGRGNPTSYSLRDGEKLLDLWQAADIWNKRVHVEQYSLLSDSPVDIATTARDGLGWENLAFTQWFAASLRYAYTTPPLVSAYVQKDRIPEIRFARRVSEGGNLWLILPEDEGVFFETRDVKGFRLVSDIQIYLDLIRAGLRGPEQAEALRKWDGFNK